MVGVKDQDGMEIYKTRWFHKWASKEGLTDRALRAAIAEMALGLVDADLGGRLFKKRIGLTGRGKRGGARTLVAVHWERRAFFLYGFAKKERADISARELQALKLLAAELLGYDNKHMATVLKAGELIQVPHDE